MRIFGLRPMSTWDRASNLIKIMTQSSSTMERTTSSTFKYSLPKSETSNIIEKHSLLQKYLPKSKEELLSKLGISKKG